MNRKTFLASIAAMIAAPFIVKAKPEEKKSNMTVKITADVSEFKKQIEDLQSQVDKLLATQSTIKMDGALRVKGSDLHLVIDRPVKPRDIF